MRHLYRHVFLVSDACLDDDVPHPPHLIILSYTEREGKSAISYVCDGFVPVFIQKVRSSRRLMFSLDVLVYYARRCYLSHYLFLW